MRRFLATLCIAATALVVSAQAPPAIQPPAAADIGPVKAGNLTLESNIDKASYAIGADIGKNFQKAGIALNLEAMAQGYKDVQGDEKPAMTDEQMAAVMMEFQQTMMAKMKEAQGREAEESKVTGAEFLTAKAQEPGLKKTDSGLLYEVVEEGTGNSPQASDTVKVHYTGTLIDGTKFDSSHDRGAPAEFQVGRVIKGWQEALQMMKEGSHWKLYIPGDLAYGPQGNPRGGIPGNAVLVFDVQLIEVVQKPANEVTIPQSVPKAQ